MSYALLLLNNMDIDSDLMNFSSMHLISFECNENRLIRFLSIFLVFSFIFNRVGFPVMIGSVVVATVYLMICHVLFTWH